MNFVDFSALSGAGEGGTDSAKLAAAVAECESSGVPNLYLPRADYSFDEKLVVKSGVRFFGDGVSQTSCKWTGTGVWLLFEPDAAHTSSIATLGGGCRDFGIVADGTANAYAIQVKPLAGAGFQAGFHTFRDLNLTYINGGSWWQAIQFDGANRATGPLPGVRGCRIESCNVFSQPGRSAINLNTVHTCTVEGCHFYGGTGVSVGGGSTNIVQTGNILQAS